MVPLKSDYSSMVSNLGQAGFVLPQTVTFGFIIIAYALEMQTLCCYKHQSLHLLPLS